MNTFQLISLAELEAKLNGSAPLIRPMLVVFKGQLCGVCHVNIPLIEKFFTDHPQNLDMYGIDVDHEDLGAEDQKNPKGSITIAPTYHLYDQSKKLVFTHLAFLSNEQLTNALKALN